ncbi:hypothetical protein EG329_001155 [Mollisiaceae sp. DMI_Dod_QoI]|nr:hypothetical protein EG329_001155 [Helotiales sp. DMI_Dod_QoI]
MSNNDVPTTNPIVHKDKIEVTSKPKPHLPLYDIYDNNSSSKTDVKGDTLLGRGQTGPHAVSKTAHEWNIYINTEDGMKKDHLDTHLMCWAYEVEDMKLTLAERLEKIKWDN